MRAPFLVTFFALLGIGAAAEELRCEPGAACPEDAEDPALKHLWLLQFGHQLRHSAAIIGGTAEVELADAQSEVQLDAQGEVRDDAQVYEQARVEDDLEAQFLELCAAAIVKETCTLLGGDLSGAADDVTQQELQAALSSSGSSIKVFWKLMDLPTTPLGADGTPEVKCDTICHMVVDRVQQVTFLPPTSDTGCYQDGEETKCDLDLRPKEVAKLVGKGDLPDLHDEAVISNITQQSSSGLDDAIEAAANGTGPELQWHRNPKTLQYTPLELALRLLNLFRIYPAPRVVFAGNESASDPLLADVPLSLIRAAGSAGDDPRHGTEGCSFWCGARDCAHSSCRACGQCAGYAAGPAAASWEPFALGLREQSGEKIVATAGIESTQPASWRTTVQQRNAQAQVYVSTAIRKYKLKQTDALIRKWFGLTAVKDVSYGQEITRILNAVAQMLGNVEYVYPAVDCAETTYAYVYPSGEGSRNTKGQYLFYLCPLYMTSPKSEQIETLTHEGSHHATAFTDDVCMDRFQGGARPRYFEQPKRNFPANVALGEVYTLDAFGVDAVVTLVKSSTVVLTEAATDDCQNTAYGRDTCQQLARLDSIMAMRNADSLCYYIQDVTDVPR